MSISFSQIAASSLRQSLRASGAKLDNSLSKVSGGEAISKTLEDISSFSAATNLQTQTSSLRSASLNITKADSMLQIADSGAKQVSSILEHLGEIAETASNGALADLTLESLNLEFNHLIQQIDAVAVNSNFNGDSLLSGAGDSAFKVSESSDGGLSLSIGSLDTDAIFNGESLNILSTESAKQASSILGSAIDSVTAQRVGIATFSEALGFAGANIESAIQNQEAARSNLSNDDNNALALIQKDSGLATLAQAGKFNSNLLNLIN